MKSNGKKLHDAVDHMGVLDICIHINVYCSNVNRNWHLEKKVYTKASTTVEFIAYIQYQQPAPINTYTSKPSVHGSSTCEWCFQYQAGFFFVALEFYLASAIHTNVLLMFIFGSF